MKQQKQKMPPVMTLCDVYRRRNEFHLLCAELVRCRRAYLKASKNR